MGHTLQRCVENTGHGLLVVHGQFLESFTTVHSGGNASSASIFNREVILYVSLSPVPVLVSESAPSTLDVVSSGDGLSDRPSLLLVLACSLGRPRNRRGATYSNRMQDGHNAQTGHGRFLRWHCAIGLGVMSCLGQREYEERWVL